MHSISSTPGRARLAAATALAATAVLGGAAYATSQGAPPAQDAVSASSSSTAADKALKQFKMRLKTSSPELADCFPHARSRVKVALTTDDIGKDTFHIRAHGLKPRTDFTIFLIEQAGAPFGHVEYIGDMTTNRYGVAHNTFDLIVEEAFALDNVTQERADLNSIGFWFADEKDDDGCLGKGSPVTGFDGDAAAGVQMMNSGRRQLP